MFLPARCQAWEPAASCGDSEGLWLGGRNDVGKARAAKDQGCLGRVLQEMQIRCGWDQAQGSWRLGPAGGLGFSPLPSLHPSSPPVNTSVWRRGLEQVQNPISVLDPGAGVSSWVYLIILINTVPSFPSTALQH